jgi:MFS family permease
MKALIEQRYGEQLNFILFAAGKSVSILGSSIYSFAIGLYVLKLTGSALDFATTIMLGVVPMILISPIAGVVADRIPKKWLVVGMDSINGILFLILYGIAIGGGLNLPVIYVSTVLLNVFTTFFGIGIEAAKPNLVTRDKRVRLNAVGKLIDSSAAILGPIVGGLVYVMVDIKAFILFNGFSFLLSALTEWFIDYDFYRPEEVSITEQKHGFSLKSDIVEGFRYFKHSKPILELFYIFVSLNFLLGFSVNIPGPYIINELLKLSPNAYGIIYAMFSVGLIIGTLTVEAVMKRFEYRRLLIGMNGIIAIAASLVGLPTLFPSRTEVGIYVLYYGMLHVIMGIAIAYVDVPIMTLLQNEIPEALRGRVLSLVMSFVKIVLPIALLLSGALINKIDIVWIPVIGASVALIYSLYLLYEEWSQLHAKDLVVLEELSGE